MAALSVLLLQKMMSKFCCFLSAKHGLWICEMDLVKTCTFFQNSKQLGMAFSVGYLAANEASNDSKCASKILLWRSTKQGMVDSMDKVYLCQFSSK